LHNEKCTPYNIWDKKRPEPFVYALFYDREVSLSIEKQISRNDEEQWDSEIRGGMQQILKEKRSGISSTGVIRVDEKDSNYRDE